jgi:hypothetical protein
MALNIEKIKQRLASFEKKGKSQSKTKDSIWKPVAGKQVVRIVPYQHQPDDPFIQLKFHYDFAGKNYLSPSSFNKADPIVELSDRLKKNSDTWKQGREIEPKLRTYVPVIVRGEEAKGVRFWGFGVQIYKQLMQTMSEPDYGDITSLTEGYDIQVEFKTAKEVGKDYPETTIMVKPKPRPVIDPTDPKAKELMEMITTKQPNMLEVYDVPTYEILATALEDYLKKASEGQQEESGDGVECPTDAQIEAATAPITPPTTVNVAQVTTEAPKTETVPTPTPPSVVSPSAAKAATVPTTAQDLTKAFDNLFNT